MISHTMPVVSNKVFRTFIISLIALFFTGCVTTKGPQKTSIELQAFQAREFETTKQIAFAATMTVFQDLGYTIGSADVGTGFISAKSPTKQDFVLFVGQRMQAVKATAFIESMGEKRANIRLNFVNSTQTSSGYGMKGGHDLPIEDPSVYQETFVKIQKAIFVRENIEGQLFNLSIISG